MKKKLKIFLFNFLSINLFKESDVPTIANINKNEDFTLYIGRANRDKNLAESKWHNPFSFRKEVDRAPAMLRYEHYITENPKLLHDLGELAGETLGCYCFSTKSELKGKICHGHTLIRLFREKYLELYK